MDCKKTEGLLNRYADGELGLEQAASVENHINTCPVCSLTFKKLGKVGELMGLIEDIRPRSSFTADVMSGLDKSRGFSWNILGTLSYLLIFIIFSFAGSLFSGFSESIKPEVEISSVYPEKELLKSQDISVLELDFEEYLSTEDVTNE